MHLFALPLFYGLRAFYSTAALTRLLLQSICVRPRAATVDQHPSVREPSVSLVRTDAPRRTSNVVLGQPIIINYPSFGEEPSFTTGYVAPRLTIAKQQSETIDWHPTPIIEVRRESPDEQAI